MAERFNQKVNLQVQNTGTGAASGLMNLSNKFRTLAGQERQKREAKAIEESTLAGQQAFAKGNKPRFMDEDRLIGGVTAKAYNNGLRAAYTSSVKNDALLELNEIEKSSGDNLQEYMQRVEASVSGVIDQVDPVAAPDVKNFLDTQTAQATLRVQTKQLDSQRRLAVSQTDAALKSLSDTASVQARSGDVASSASTLINFNSEVDKAVQADIIDESKAVEIKRNAELKSAQSNIVGSTRRMVEAGQASTALKVIESLRLSQVKGMTQDEQDTLLGMVITDVNQSLALSNKQDALEDAAAGASQKDYSQKLYTDIILGNADGTTVVSATQQNKISQSQASTLMNLVNSQGAGIDDWALITVIQNDINDNQNPDQIIDVIQRNTGTRLTQATAARLMETISDSVEDGSPLQTEEYKFAIKYMEEIVAPSGLFGRFDETSGRRFAELNRQARERVLKGENPMLVVDSLIPKDSILKQRFDLESSTGVTDGDVEKMKEAIQSKAASGAMDGETYNRLYYEIEAYGKSASSLDNFKALKKESLNAN